MSYRYTSSSYKYSSTGEEDSSSVRRSSFRSRASIDDENLMSSVSRSTRITRTLISGSDEPATTTSTISTTRRRLTSDDDDFGLSRRSFDDDSISRFSRQLAEEASDEAFSSKRTKVEMEGGITGYSTRSSKITHIDSGEVKSFETSSKQSYSSTFGSEGGDLQMLEDSSPVGSIYVTILDYKPLTTDEDGLVLKEGDEVKVLETGKPRKWKVFKMSTGQSGWVGSYCLEKTAGAVATTERVTSMQEKKISEVYLTRKETLVKELVETEEDFARDMLYVVNNYMKEMDNPAMPKRLREFKDQLFCNFKDICDFHNDQLITGIKFNAREPTKLGTTLLRMERDFDKHVKYVEQEHKAQQLLKDEPELREYLERFSKKIGDEKTIQEHLKLPLQRINDYQLILKELIKCNAKAGEDFNDLQRALDFMQAIPQRSVDLDYINRMEGYSGNIQKFGRILKETTGTTVSEEAGNLKLTSTSEGPIIMKVDDKEEWSKQLQASTVKSEVVEKMTADEELRVKEEEVSTRIEITQEDDANRTTTTGGTESLRSGSITSVDDELLSVASNLELDADIVVSTAVSDLEPRGTSPTSGEKPKFVQTLRGISTHRNDTATLECIIESEPAPQLKWLKNNVPVRKGPRITQFSDSKTGRHSLTISNAQPEDAAMYTIVASNPSGTTSCSAPFNVRTASGRPDSRPTSPGGTELPFAPVFKVKLKDTELLEGTSVRFELVVHGFPTPEVAFYKDGEPLQMDDRIRVHYENKEVFELIIDHVTEQDSAVYSCVAMNSEGCDSTAGCITVTKSKVLFQGLTEDGNAGDKSTTPQPTVSPAFTWFKDGKEFEASERFQVAFNDDEDTLALVFQHVKPEDAGIYTCVASTYSGKISCSAELTVQGAVNYKEPSAPTIEANIEDVEVSEGASAMLELKITGWPKPRIVWTKGEKLIESGYGGKYKFLFEDDESMTLVIRSVTKEDAGKYDIVAENELGSASTHCNLHVKCPPKFKKELKDASVMTETPLKLDVEVEGLPEPDVKWYKDGQQVFNTERVKLVHQVDSASYALVVDKAKVDDAGSYTCVISNPLGSQSGHAAVTVNSAPKIIKKLESYEATITETVKLSTKIAGVPKPKVEWLKNGQAVLIDGKKYVASEDETNVFSLTIDCCGPDDVGSYTVVVTNDYGKAEDSAQLTIKIKPKFTRGLKEKELVESEVDIELTVVVEAQPEPTVQWWHDGVLIKDSNLYVTKAMTENGQYTLVIKQAVAEAGGTIKCTAENKHGKANTEAKVTVNAKPKITEGLKNQSVVTGADATFTIKYAGAPKPEATWMKDGAEIKVDGSHYRVSEAEAQYTLVIKDCKDDDKGLYKAVIENKYGRDESSAELKVVAKVIKPPTFAQGLKPSKFVEGGVGRLDAKLNPNDDGSMPDVEWLKNGNPLTEADGVRFIKNPDGTVALEIPKCKPEDAGKYTLRVKNPDGGIAESSAPVEVSRNVPVFEIQLKGLNLTEGDELKLVCKVNSDTAITAKWFRDGVEVAPDPLVATKIEPDGSVLLTIASCIPGDAGKYRCEVTNQTGTSSSEANVSVKALKREKPIIIDGLKATAFDEDKPGKVEAKVGGFPKPDVHWLKDGKPITDPRIKIETKPDGTTILAIDKVKPEDAGEYSIVAKNDQGENKSSAPVTVNKKPSFLKPLEACTVHTSETAKLTSKVVGLPKPKIEWLKDGKPIKPDGNRIVAAEDDEGNCNLTIKDATPADAGNYAIKATNPSGEMKSEVPVEIIDDKAPTFLSPLKDQNVPEGGKLVLEARVTGSTALKIKWFHKGKPITEADDASTSFNGETARLEIPKTAMAHAGEYECKLLSPAGEKSSKANVKVLRPPKFIKPLLDTDVPLSMPLVLECEVLCDDEPEVAWTFRGAPIHDGSKYTITKINGRCKLFIANPSINDCGEYQCSAKNAAGQDSTACKGTIKEPAAAADSGEPPSFLKKLTDQEVTVGSTAKLIACIAGKPEPDVEWYKDGSNVALTDRHSFERDRNGIIRLVIQNLTERDFGEYRCEISNPHGKADCSCKLSEDCKLNWFAQRDNDYNNLCTNQDALSVEGSNISISAYYRECLKSMPNFRNDDVSNRTVDPDPNTNRKRPLNTEEESRSECLFVVNSSGNTVHATRTDSENSFSGHYRSALSDAEVDGNSLGSRKLNTRLISMKDNPSNNLTQSNEKEVSIFDYYRHVLPKTKVSSDCLPCQGSSGKRKHRKHGSPPDLPSRGSSQKKKERKQHCTVTSDLVPTKISGTNEPSIADYYRAVLSLPGEPEKNPGHTLFQRCSSVKKKQRKQRSLEDYDDTVELTIAAYSKYANETEDEGHRPKLPPRASSTKKKGNKSSSPKSPASPAFDSREKTMSISEYAKYASESEEACTAAPLRRQELPSRSLRKQRPSEEAKDSSMSIVAYARFASENEDSDIEPNNRDTHAKRLKEVIVECGNEVISIAAYSRNNSGVREEDLNVVTEQQTVKPSRPSRHVYEQDKPDDQKSIAPYLQCDECSEDYEPTSFYVKAPKQAVAAVEKSILQNVSLMPYISLQPDSALDEELSIGAYSRYASGTDESETEYMATRFALPVRGSSVKKKEPRASLKKENLLEEAFAEKRSQEQSPVAVKTVLTDHSEKRANSDDADLRANNELSISAYSRYVSSNESEAESDEFDRKRREAARKVLKMSYDYAADDEGSRTDVEAKFKVILDKKTKKTVITELIESSERLELEVQQVRAPRKGFAEKKGATTIGSTSSETVSETESNAELFVPRRVIPKLVIEQSSKMVITYEGEDNDQFIRIEEPVTPNNVSQEIKIVVTGTDQSKEHSANQIMSIKEISDHSDSQDLRFPDFIDEVSIAAYSKYASEAESDAELFIPRQPKKAHGVTESADKSRVPSATTTIKYGCNSENTSSSLLDAQTELSIFAYSRYASEAESDTEISRAGSMKPPLKETRHDPCEQIKASENKEPKSRPSTRSRPVDDGLMSIAAYAKYASDTEPETKTTDVSVTTCHVETTIPQIRDETQDVKKLYCQHESIGRMSIAAYARYASEVESDVETQPQVRQGRPKTASAVSLDDKFPPSRRPLGKHVRSGQTLDGQSSVAAYTRYMNESDAESAETLKNTENAEIIRSRSVITKTAGSPADSRTAIKYNKNELSIAEYSRYASSSDAEGCQTGQTAHGKTKATQQGVIDAGHQERTLSEAHEHRLSIAKYARFASDAESDVDICRPSEQPQPLPRQRPSKRSDEVVSLELSISEYSKYASGVSDAESIPEEEKHYSYHPQQHLSPGVKERTMSIVEYSKRCNDSEVTTDVEPQGTRSPKSQKRTLKQMNGTEEISIATYARYASEPKAERYPTPSEWVDRTRLPQTANYASELEEVIQLEKVGKVASSTPSVRAKVRPAGGTISSKKENRLSIAQYARYASETDDSDAEAFRNQRERMSKHVEELIEARRHEEPGFPSKASPPRAGSPNQNRKAFRNDSHQARNNSSESESNSVRRKGKKGEELSEAPDLKYERDSSGFESDVTDSDAGSVNAKAGTPFTKRFDSIETRREQFAKIFDKSYRPPSETRRNYDTDGYASQMDERTIPERFVAPSVQVRLCQRSTECEEPQGEEPITHEVPMQYEAESHKEQGRSTTPQDAHLVSAADTGSNNQQKWTASPLSNIPSLVEETELERHDHAIDSIESLATYARFLLTIMVTCVVCLCMNQAYSSLTVSLNRRGFPGHGGDDDPSDSDFDEFITNLGLGLVYKCARKRCCKDDDANA